MASEKLGLFLKDVANWGWDDFLKAEHDKTYTSNQAIIFSLIRACSIEKIEAIRMTLNRLDGKLKTPVKIELPKIYYLFPDAKLPKEVKSADTTITKRDNGDVVSGGGTGPGVESKEVATIVSPEDSDSDLPSMTLRETLTKMADYPRDLPEAIIALALATDQWFRAQGPKPDEIPKVKSVVAAHLLVMAQKRNIDALSEVFDQIDGKLAETIQLLGDDIYITSYMTEAPQGAYLNDDGVLQMEADAAQLLWATKLGAGKK